MSSHDPSKKSLLESKLMSAPKQIQKYDKRNSTESNTQRHPTSYQDINHSSSQPRDRPRPFSFPTRLTYVKCKVSSFQNVHNQPPTPLLTPSPPPLTNNPTQTQPFRFHRPPPTAPSPEQGLEPSPPEVVGFELALAPVPVQVLRCRLRLSARISRPQRGHEACSFQ
jgi:hypothetical protein